MTTRREVICGLGGYWVVGARVASGQQAAMPVIGLFRYFFLREVGGQMVEKKCPAAMTTGLYH